MLPALHRPALLYRVIFDNCRPFSQQRMQTLKKDWAGMYLNGLVLLAPSMPITEYKTWLC
jgi:hypothetical protein